MGAAIGLAGDWTGRRSERRQAERLRAVAVEDATREREWRIEEQRMRDREMRQTDLLQRLLVNASALSTGPGTDVDSDAYLASLADLINVLSIEGLQVVDPELRRRIGVAWRALDAVVGPEISASFVDYTRWEVVFTVRVGLVNSIGAALRGDEELPPLSPDWDRVTTAALAAAEAWRASMRREGFDARP